MLTHGLPLLDMTRVLQRKNQIGDRGAEMIGEGLKINSSLRELVLVRLFWFRCVLIVAVPFLRSCLSFGVF